ncbi:MAG: exo-alpha-sialidase [Chloroflexi bacterium]|nr:exo-alpha-sialidase [Chloroflexota bacterium]
MHIVASGYVHNGHGVPFHQRSCSRTAAALLHDGTLLVSFRRGSDRESPDGHECVMASTDGGNTWQERFDGYGRGAWDGTPGEVKGFFIGEDAPGVLTATGLWTDGSDPALPFINPQTQGLLPMRTFHTTSTDGGRTWGPRRHMDTAPHVGASPASSVILHLPNGVLAQAYETWKEYDDPSPAWPGAYFRLSYDQGATWPEFVTLAHHPQRALYYWDQRHAVHPETGELVVMYWTHNPATGKDEDIHISWGSKDARSWTVPQETGLPGQHCQPIALGGNRLAAIYTHRRNPPGIRLAISEDFGRTWDRSQEVIVYDSRIGTEPGAQSSRAQADLWNDMIAWRFGHPRGLLLPSGEIFAVYYAGDDQIKSACWARIAL